MNGVLGRKMKFSSFFVFGGEAWRIDGTDVRRSAGERVRGEISGIVGRWGTLTDAEGRREMRGGVGNVNSLTVIPAALPLGSANCTFQGFLGLEGLLGCRRGIAGGGRTGLGKGGTFFWAVSRRSERLWR